MDFKHPSKIRVWEPLLMFLLVGIGLIYGVNAFNTGNLTWFIRENHIVTPSRIVVVNYGERLEVDPTSAEYDMLATAVSQSLSRLNNTDLVSIGLSQQTLADYANDSLVVELYFDEPLSLNTLARTGEPTQLLVPIEGRHAAGGYVFRGDAGEWWFGAVRMGDPQPLLQALAQMGFQVTRLQPAG